jgi:hypothetical protein
MSSNEDKITAFWQWFVKSEKVIKECIELDSSPNQSYIVDQMNELILDLGVFTWDVGLDTSNQWFLTISPNGNNEYLKVSQEIMLSSPEHMNWNFHSSKLAKDWNRKFTVHSFEMEEFSVDAESWEFISTKNDENTFDLVLIASNVKHFDADTTELVAHQFLVSELGELVTITRIATVALVTEIEGDKEALRTPISKLKEIIL